MVFLLFLILWVSGLRIKKIRHIMFCFLSVLTVVFIGNFGFKDTLGLGYNAVMIGLSALGLAAFTFLGKSHGM